MIINDIYEFSKVDISIYRYNSMGYPVYISLEGLNPAGSIKLSAAISMIQYFEKKFSSQVIKGKTIVESSSGNLAIALAQICKARGYRFAAIIDPLISSNVLKLLKIYGAELFTVTKKDDNHSYLGTRYAKARELEDTGEYIWTMQYDNPANPQGHYEVTAKRIYKHMPDPDYLFIGAGTCGTLCGVSRFYKERNPETRIIAVDVDGSIAIGGSAKPRRIPGMGASRRATHDAEQYIDGKIWISEDQGLEMIKEMLSTTGFLFGGSTGIVMAAIKQYFLKRNNPDSVLTLSPDFGEKYSDIYMELGWKK